MLRPTREDVIATFGPLDDRVVSEVVATGATKAELAQARAWIDSDDAMMNEGRPLPAGPIGQVVEILTTLDEDAEPA